MHQSALIRARPGVRLRVADLGSLRLALWLIGLFGLAVAASYFGLSNATWALAVPLGLLAANLVAAVATNPIFRAQGALLVFHLGLIALIVLAAVGRLTYLKGSVELSEGQLFEGTLTQRENGPLHGEGLARVRFANLGFEVNYQPGLQRAQTRNRVGFAADDGVASELVIGDTTPLKLNGYRFYTTSNKGFAPALVWTAHDGGKPMLGTIHMPSFPAHLTRQSLDWTPPGATQVLNARLEIDDNVIDLGQAWVLRPPAVHALTLRTGDAAVTLRPGESHRFAEGTLRYQGLRMWMGYTVSYDWTIPWLLAACAVAVAALAWHFAAKFRRQSWQAVDVAGRA